MTSKNIDNLRYLSAKIIIKILNGSSLRDIDFSKETNSHKNINLIKALTYGVIRHYWELDAISQKLLSKKLKNKDQDVHILLLTGLFELLYLNSKSFAVINETVEACKHFKKPWAKNLINACLRTFSRTYLDNPDKLENFKNNSNHPEWLSNLIENNWPKFYEQIIKANNNKAPLTLRINTVNITKENYLNLLQENDIDYNLISGLDDAVIISKPINHDLIPGWDQGYFYIQDAASQLAIKFLNINNKDINILDACAAPGGKTSYIMQILHSLNNNSQLISIDNSQSRINKITENLEHLKLLNNNIKIICDDVNNIEKLVHNNLKFNKILLDAPCSATGVIRRHPDIKHHRVIEDIEKLNIIQLNLIKKLWDVLNNDGELLYCTCSILDEENEEIIKNFINYLKDKDYKFEIINLDINQDNLENKNLIKRTYGLSFIPEAMGAFDGFYYCKIKKLN